MGTAFGIWNHMAADGLSQRGAVPVSNASGGSTDGNGSSTGGDSAAITANDFLLLLVTEMKNQDPTANTDPNQYINQLVQVNSLQQLIAINQTLTANSGADSPASRTTSAGPGLAGFSPNMNSQAPHMAGETHQAVAQPAATLHSNIAHPATTTRFASGNLTVPTAQPAAQRVAESLAGSARTSYAPGLAASSTHPPRP
jgi:flagellar basal-body rod modification protein FlgD